MLFVNAENINYAYEHQSSNIPLLSIANKGVLQLEQIFLLPVRFDVSA